MTKTKSKALRLSSDELDAMEYWAKSLTDKKQTARVLLLVQEARDHRKLLGQLHDDLINEMS
jgi:hypothetical protein